MIKLIVGRKGEGKTKQMVDMINENAPKVKGNVVCIEKCMQLTYNIDKDVRLIDIDEYNIDGYDKFYGFFAGVLASNYDIEQIYIDGVLRICSRALPELGNLLEKIDVISKDKLVVLTVSADKSELPESVNKYL